MNGFCYVLLAILAVSTSIICSGTQQSLKVIKQNRNHAGEESFRIKRDDTILYTSPQMSNDQLYSVDICLDTVNNDQYNLEMNDSYGDSWSSGSYLELQGPNENLVFKGYLYDKRTVTYPLSLYNPIKTTGEWKFTNGATGEWTTVSYIDSQWITVVLNSPTTSSTGTQYLRKSFTGLVDLAAYELRMRFRHGIIAYMNGVEIFRRNMPTGPITSDTHASGSYDSLAYRGIIRSGSELTALSVLAVEIHFTNSATDTSITFDAWLSQYALSMNSNNCYPVMYTPTITASAGVNANYVMDFYTSRAYSIISDDVVHTLTFAFSTLVIPVINAIMWYPGSSFNNGATTYSVSGSLTSDSASGYSHIKTMYQQEYDENTMTIAPIYGVSTMYGSYRFTWITTPHELIIPELYAAVCNIPIPTSLTVIPSTMSVAKNIENLSVSVSTLGAGNCTITPLLPSGLVFNSDSCSINGIAIETFPLTIFTITSNLLNSITGTFTLLVNDCLGSIVEIERIYKSSSVKEHYRIINLDTNLDIVTVNPSSDQVDNVIQIRRICALATRYEVKVGSTSDFWEKGSLLNVYVVNGGQREQILRCNYDNHHLLLSSSYFFSAIQPIKIHDQWYQKNNEIPTNWYDSSVTGWQQGSFGSFQNSTNQIQLYKKIFNVASLSYGGAFSIGIRYKYGIIIYMNNIEVYRNNIPNGELSLSMLANNLYNDIIYRYITLPYKSIIINNDIANDYLKENTNIIAIAIIGPNTNPAISLFDLVLRPFGSDISNRVMDATYSFNNIKGTTDDAWNLHYNDGYYNPACGDNWAQIRFNNDRREWISSSTLMLYYYSFLRLFRSFQMEARNNEAEGWTSLMSMNGLKWWSMGQKKVFNLNNNKPYNMYRFTNFASDITDCYWYVNMIEIHANRIDTNIPDLSYETPLVAFCNIEMAEVYPNAAQYLQYTISPALPAGLSIDPPTGILMGTPTELINNYKFTVSALKLSGVATTFEITISIIACTDQYNLITMTLRTDSYPSEISWKMVKGRGDGGEIIKYVTDIPERNTVLYYDFCIIPNLYTFIGYDRDGDNWGEPAGVSLSIDQGKLRFEMLQMYKMPKPGVISTTFYSHLPFQIEYSDWHVAAKSSLAIGAWTSIEYDDSQWDNIKASEIGPCSEVTLYIRKSISIPNLDDYQVLNIRVAYLDGLVVYFNSHRVALFNMPMEVTATTHALSSHDATLFSKFHVILSQEGAVSGINVMAFEMHRSIDTSTSIPMVFDASAVFGVNICSPVLDSYTDIEGSPPSMGSLVDAFDLYMVTKLRLGRIEGVYVQWRVENLLGSRFNQFAIQNGVLIKSIFYTLYGLIDNSLDRYSIVEVKGKEFLSSKRETEDSPVGFMGFQSYRFEQENTPNENLVVLSFVTLYCKAVGATCPAIEGYPSVAEGQLSPGHCMYGYHGYSYRICIDGQLGAVQTERCKHKVPENLIYGRQAFTFVLGLSSSTGKPRYDNIITDFSLDNVDLPIGLMLNNVTGEINGIPTNLTNISAFTIYGRNMEAAASVTITITVRIGICFAEGYFAKTDVGKVSVYECNGLGSYIGTKTRECILGKTDGEWRKETGMCISIVLLVIVVIVVIAIIAIIIIVLIKVNKKGKIAPGVKGKAAPGNKGKTIKKQQYNTTKV